MDLWRAHRGQRLVVRRLQAASLDGNLERMSDGRVSWQLGQNAQPNAAAELAPPVVEQLQVNSGRLRLLDEALDLDVQALLSLVDEQAASTLRLSANGKYRKLPLKVDLQAAGVMPWATADSHATVLPFTLSASVGKAQLSLQGSAKDALHLRGLSGRFNLSGPSLAAVGDPVGLTLPTTAPFRAKGFITQTGDSWFARIDEANVGATRLNGSFKFEPGRPVPLLSGRLGGSRLALVDLGPVVGTTTVMTAPPDESSVKPLEQAKGALRASTRAKGRVLPNRPFDLAALRKMDANVLIDIAELDANTTWLAPLRPLHAHLRLEQGVLSLQDLDARMGGGRLAGELRLDGRNAEALWTADLRWDAVQLEQWIRFRRSDSAPPYVTGRLGGRANLAGRGRSTAEILASLKGQVLTTLQGGQISHLAIELAGVDIAEGLGVMLKGDDLLPVHCAVADLVVDAGVFRPRVMVLDTPDSAAWVEGSLSLASEAIDLRAVVSPKDFSPLALRTPLRVQGTLASPQLTLEKGPMGRKLAAAFLLALVNPLAALIPLIDTGDAQAAAAAAARGTAGCRSLAQRHHRPVPVIKK